MRYALLAREQERLAAARHEPAALIEPLNGT
jgi:hypothetical protein